MEISLFLHGIKDILPRSDDKNLHSKWKKMIYFCYQLRMNKNKTILGKITWKSFQQLSRTPYIIWKYFIEKYLFHKLHYNLRGSRW